jgi:hypothetical protein
MANEQANRLPEANGSSGTEHPEPEKKARLLRVRVIEDGHPKVNVKVPIGVARWGMKMAKAFSPEMKEADLDWEAITEAIQQADGGKIVEVEDEDNHKTVEVWVE